MKGVTVEGNQHGLRVRKAAVAKLEGCTVRSCKSAGVTVRNAGTHAEVRKWQLCLAVHSLDLQHIPDQTDMHRVPRS